MPKQRRLTWRRTDTGSWNCYNESEEWLGNLSRQRVGRHIHWCWRQAAGVIMSPGCLDEVRDKQKELFKQRKKK